MTGYLENLIVAGGAVLPLLLFAALCFAIALGLRAANDRDDAREDVRDLMRRNAELRAENDRLLGIARRRAPIVVGPERRSKS
ncbi:hypothetical protein [Pimelobacter simplex]|uniref:hypothetical protein n=1 Tax=Nocardioides simplex TaxID=2045 RepID=UPI00214FB33C|nr:hypothetical protein [Pimelobacter simplex]UUW88353.1 hypothetical protein M0M43_21775 [Pimelobacter simplex]UUW97857.1 hypothetical protein M0M48_10420 [Pimelobacter simplex]